MHSIATIDIVRRDLDLAQAHAERTGQHLASLRAFCRRARGLRGLLGGCARA